MTTSSCKSMTSSYKNNNRWDKAKPSAGKARAKFRLSKK